MTLHKQMTRMENINSIIFQYLEYLVSVCPYKNWCDLVFFYALSLTESVIQIRNFV